MSTVSMLAELRDRVAGPDAPLSPCPALHPLPLSRIDDLAGACRAGQPLPGPAEARYREATAEQRAGIIRLWLCLVAAIDALCILIDAINIGAYPGTILAIRLGMGASVIAGMALLLKHPRARPLAPACVLIRFPLDQSGHRISQPARRLSEAEIRIAKQSTGFRMTTCVVITITGGLIGHLDTPEMQTVHAIACLLALFSALLGLPLGNGIASLTTGLCWLVFSGFVIAMGAAPATKASILIYFSGSMAATLVIHRHTEAQRRLAFLDGLRDQARSDALADMNERLTRANARLALVMRTDPLTGIANRRAFDEMTAAHWAAGAADRCPVGTLLIDVDSFKSFNDHEGHQAGDACLRTVAGILEAESGPDAFVARYGGEEFVVLVPRGDGPACGRLAERLRLAVERRALPHAGSPFGVVTISIGHACGRPWFADEAETVRAHADKALYAAKNAGRNAVRAAEAESLAKAG